LWRIVPLGTIRIAQKNQEVAGLYHLVASGVTTWYDYAALVFSEARKADVALAIKQLNKVPTSAYPTPACRPNNSRLNNEKFQRTFGLVLPNWEKGVKRMLNELLLRQQSEYNVSARHWVLLRIKR
jgi:dTDP-4-dehydrorhamnose reductase